LSLLPSATSGQRIGGLIVPHDLAETITAAANCSEIHALDLYNLKALRDIAHAMAERRTEFRMLADKEVHVKFVDGGWVCLGTIVDLSLSGARVTVETPIDVGAKLDLFFDNRQRSFRCIVVRSQGQEIGVSFDLPATPS
jgi:hypothetical protein